MSGEDIAQWFFGLMREAVRQELRAQSQADEWIPQKGSALGNRKHCAAVRRRIANGEGGAAIRGKRCLLTTTALTEELTRGGPPPGPHPPVMLKAKPEPDATYAAVLQLARRTR